MYIKLLLKNLTQIDLEDLDADDRIAKLILKEAWWKGVYLIHLVETRNVTNTYIFDFQGMKFLNSPSMYQLFKAGPVQSHHIVQTTWTKVRRVPSSQKPVLFSRSQSNYHSMFPTSHKSPYIADRNFRFLFFHQQLYVRSFPRTKAFSDTLENA